MTAGGKRGGAGSRRETCSAPSERSKVIERPSALSTTRSDAMDTMPIPCSSMSPTRRNSSREVGPWSTSDQRRAASGTAARSPEQRAEVLAARGAPPLPEPQHRAYRHREPCDRLHHVARETEERDGRVVMRLAVEDQQ